MRTRADLVEIGERDALCSMLVVVTGVTRRQAAPRGEACGTTQGEKRGGRPGGGGAPLHAIRRRRVLGRRGQVVARGARTETWQIGRWGLRSCAPSVPAGERTGKGRRTSLLVPEAPESIGHASRA